MIIDSHCHLDYKGLQEVQANVVARARQAGVSHMVNISTTIRQFPAVLVTAERYEDVSCSLGVHPHHTNEEGENASIDQLISLGQNPKIVGIGETGLDYFYDTAPREVQQDSFRRHIRAARTLGLPIIVHTRDAEEDTAMILREEGALDGAHPLTGVLHCFTSSRDLAEAALALGFYISLSGIITFKKSEALREVARDIPLDRLLVETDSPFLAPEPYRGKPCEPAYVVHTARAVAALKGISLEECMKATTDNFYRLFTKAARSS